MPHPEEPRSLRGVSKDVPPSSFETRAKARSSGGGLASIQPCAFGIGWVRLNLRRGLCLDGSRCDSRRCGGYGGLGIGRFRLRRRRPLPPARERAGPPMAPALRRAARLRHRHEGVRLATLGIDIWRPRRSPNLADRRQRPHRTVGHAQVVIGIAVPPVRRHETDDPPIAGVDHQPPASPRDPSRRSCKPRRAAAELRAAKIRFRGGRCRPPVPAAVLAHSRGTGAPSGTAA